MLILIWNPKLNLLSRELLLHYRKRWNLIKGVSKSTGCVIPSILSCINYRVDICVTLLQCTVLNFYKPINKTFWYSVRNQ